MYDFLQFIDSPDIREYNRDTYFTPAEWAVLVGMSCSRTMEEKLEALQYLLEHFDDAAFMEGSRNIEPRTSSDDINMPSREMVVKTVQLWQDVLGDRYRNEGFLYAAAYLEKAEYGGDGISDYSFFACYDKAYAYLEKEKQVYSEDKDLREIKRTGRIYRIKLDETGHHCDNADCYIFDTELRLVYVLPSAERDSLYENGRCVPLLNEYEYRVYVPLPFKEGDIVKVESLYHESYYGVATHDWEEPAQNGLIKMRLPLEVYCKERDAFGYTDGTDSCILGCSFCKEEELPEDQQVLKLVSDVHKGKLDFYLLLHKYGRNEMDQLLKRRS